MIPPPRLHIFDVPHAVDAICDHLESKDIWQCYRVSKAWHDVFGPHRYKNIWFANLDSSQTWLILDNAHRIRNLTVDLTDAEYLNNAPCYRLKELNCIDMGYMTWRSEWELSRGYITWIDPEPTANALSLISKNPGLERLTICYQVHGIPCKPFTTEVLSALSNHPSLKTIHIDMRIDSKSIVALLTHLPKTLQDLELNPTIYEHDFNDAEYQFTIPGPTQLRRLALPGSLLTSRLGLLLLLLRQSPWLEDLRLGPIQGTSFGDVVTVLSESCPGLQSIKLTDIVVGLMRNINTLLEAYPMGLRSLILEPSWFFHPEESTVESPVGTLVESLLNYSAHTIQVIKLYGAMNHWIKGIASVLEQCPNLKELHTTEEFISLDELVHQTNWNTLSPWETEPTTADQTGSSLLLPWVCTKLEVLSLSINKPQCEFIDFSVQPYQQDQNTKDMMEDLAISITRQVGVLCGTLKSLKSLKTLILQWGSNTYQTIQTIPFERGTFYMNQIGLSGMSQRDSEWMGIPWDSTADRLRREEASKLKQTALNDRKGCNPDDPMLFDEYCWYVKHLKDEEVDEEIIWPFKMDRKKFHKSGELYSRHSLKNSAEWFGRRPRE